METHQAVLDGKPAYAPVTTRKVPKYLTPIGTSAIFRANPATHRIKPAATKGERILIWSDQYDQISAVIAVKHEV